MGKGRRRRNTHGVISHLEILHTDTLEVTPVADFPERIEAPNWLADDRLLYNAEGRLFTIEIATGRVAPVDTGSCVRCNNDHVVSRDGRTLGISCAGAQGHSQVYVLPLSGGEPRLVTEKAPSYLHGISPDGRRLAYCASRDGEFDVYDIAISGGEERRLTTAPGLDDGPEYTPDGKYIWFNSVRAGKMQIFRMTADGEKQTRMTFTQRNEWFPHISPDGQRVAYLSYGPEVDPGAHPPGKDVELHVMNIDGTGDRKLRSLFGGQGTLNVNSWAPDSARIAYVRYEE